MHIAWAHSHKHRKGSGGLYIELNSDYLPGSGVLVGAGHWGDLPFFYFIHFYSLECFLTKSTHRFYGLKSWNAYSKDLGIYRVSLLFSGFSVKPSGGQDMVTKLHTPWGCWGGNWYSRRGGHASPGVTKKLKTLHKSNNSTSENSS